jgi:hypothetical protein
MNDWLLNLGPLGWMILATLAVPVSALIFVTTWWLADLIFGIEPFP